MLLHHVSVKLHGMNLSIQLKILIKKNFVKYFFYLDDHPALEKVE